jgi:hypothetical protein
MRRKERPEPLSPELRSLIAAIVEVAKLELANQAEAGRQITGDGDRANQGPA